MGAIMGDIAQLVAMGASPMEDADLRGAASAFLAAAKSLKTTSDAAIRKLPRDQIELLQAAAAIDAAELRATIKQLSHLQAIGPLGRLAKAQVLSSLLSGRDDPVSVLALSLCKDIEEGGKL